MNASPSNEPTRQYTFDVERAIVTWRGFLEGIPSLSRDDLDELEDHLRFEIETLRGERLSDEERFRVALRRVGDIAVLSNNYSEVLWEKRMRRDRVLTEVIAAFRLFHSYFKTAWSGIVRHKAYAFLNLSGLAIALSACIIIVLYVQHELSYDNFHSKADRIYRLETQMSGSSDNNRWPTTFWLVGPELKNSIPEIETVTRVSRLIEPLVRVDEIRFFEERFLFTGPEFFDVFDLELTSGSAGRLEAPHTVILSESMASKYFQSGDATGRRIMVSERSSEQPEEYEVVGVFQDMPTNVHFGANFIASFASLGELEAGAEWYRTVYTYLVLHPNVPPSIVLDKLEAYWTNHVRAEGFREESSPALQPLGRIHLYSTAYSDIEPQGDIMYVMMFALAAALLLIVACVNYMNLAVARYAARAREVGIRKVVGANRAQLIWQFLGESIVYCSLSFLLAIVVVALTLPYFNSTMDLSLSLGTHYATVLKSFIPSIVIVGLLAGSYPAFFLSRFAPTTVLKGAFGSGQRAVLRKGLLLFQFVVTSGLIIATIVISAQLKFAQDKKLGVENEQLLILKTRGALEENASAFRDALEQIPSVVSVSFAYSFPGRATAISWYRGKEIEDYEGDTVLLDHVWADTAFVRTVGLEVVAGRAFSAERTGDSERGIVLNQAAVRAIGWSDPIGKRLGEGDNIKEVIGVVRDFHTKSMYEEITPFMLELGEQKAYTGLRVLTGNLRQTLEDVKATWEVFITDRPFEYSFLDDDFKAMYRKETRLGRLFTAFSVLTIVIAVLGLFGLVSFSAQQRTKEIGIRKALGATASNITVLLSREFVALVSVSFIASTPLIYWIMTEWLNQFAYRVDLSAGLFFLSGTVILSVSMFTVGVQAVRTALIPPVDCLRQE